MKEITKIPEKDNKNKEGIFGTIESSKKNNKLDSTITKQKLEKYFSVTESALKKAEASSNKTGLDSEREDMLDMIRRYISDARHFYKKDDFVDAFAALNYAHGWLDAGARLKIFDVHDNSLFTVDGDN